MLLIDLHNALLLGSRLSESTQLALAVTLKAELLRQSRSNAVLLLWLAGSTSKQTPELQQQLQTLIHAGILQTLVDLLPDVDHCSSAAAVLLQCIARLAAASAAPQLAALWQVPANQAYILSASCSSLPAGQAAAALLALFLSKGLPAASMLQPLVLQANSAAAAAASAGATARSWVAIAMPPLLQQLQQQLNRLQETAAGPAEQLLSISSKQQQAELWLLLLNVAAVVQTAGPSASLFELSRFFSSQTVTAAMQAALLDRSAPAVQQAAVKMTSLLAATSVELASCCFKAVAPIITDLMMMKETAAARPGLAEGGSSSSNSHTNSAAAAGCVTPQQQQQQLTAQQGEGVTAAAAVWRMWALLLQRVSKQQLEAEVGERVLLGLLNPSFCSASEVHQHV
jgi:hypothetical protein